MGAEKRRPKRAPEDPKKAPGKGARRPRLKEEMRIGKLPFCYKEVSIHQIEVEDQQRKTFDEIPELADDIRDAGQRYPCVVNFITKTGKYVLIAGERRLRAQQHILKTDKLEDILVPCFVHTDLNSWQVRVIQNSENKHREVPACQLATWLGECWDRICEERPGTTVAEFAEAFSISTGRVVSALKYHRALDPYVKAMVEKGRILYFAGVIITRLPLEHETPEGQIIFPQRIAADKVINGRRITLPAVEEIVETLRVELAGQASIYDLFGNPRAWHKRHANDALLALLTRDAGIIMAHYQTLVRRHEEGKKLTKRQLEIMRDACLLYARLQRLIATGDFDGDELIAELEGIKGDLVSAART